LLLAVQVPLTSSLATPLMALLRVDNVDVQKNASLAISNFAVNGPGNEFWFNGKFVFYVSKFYFCLLFSRLGSWPLEVVVYQQFWLWVLGIVCLFSLSFSMVLHIICFICSRWLGKCKCIFDLFKLFSK